MLGFGVKFGEILDVGDLVFLYGPLGAGKTTFVKGVSSFFGVDVNRVKSPSFTILNIYRGSSVRIYHIDLFRASPEDIPLVEEYLDPFDGVSLVEWPQILEDEFNPDYVIRIEFLPGGSGRSVEVCATSPEKRLKLGDLFP